EARQAFAEAVSLIETLRAQTIGGEAESERSFEGGLGAHHGLLTLLAMEDQPRQAFALAERTKARGLHDVLRQGHVSVEKAMRKAHAAAGGRTRGQSVGTIVRQCAEQSLRWPGGARRSR